MAKRKGSKGSRSVGALKSLTTKGGGKLGGGKLKTLFGAKVVGGSR